MAMTKTSMGKVLGAVLFSTSAVAALVACSTESASADGPAASALVKAEQTNDLGAIVVDASGKTVYSFDGDTADASACVDACPKNWPIVVASDPVPASVPGIDGTLGVFTRPDGSRQLTLDGHQLYTFAKDVEPGQRNGVGKELGESRWGIMLADGDPRY